MTLATRCPHCSTIFRVVPDQLRVSQGWVRCGRCSEAFNALESMVDWPPRAAAPAPAEPSAASTPAAPQAPAPAPAHLAQHPGEPASSGDDLAPDSEFPRTLPPEADDLQADATTAEAEPAHGRSDEPAYAPAPAPAAAPAYAPSYAPAPVPDTAPAQSLAAIDVAMHGELVVADPPWPGPEAVLSSEGAASAETEPAAISEGLITADGGDAGATGRTEPSFGFEPSADGSTQGHSIDTASEPSGPPAPSTDSTIARLFGHEPSPTPSPFVHDALAADAPTHADVNEGSSTHTTPSGPPINHAEADESADAARATVAAAATVATAAVASAEAAEADAAPAEAPSFVRQADRAERWRRPGVRAALTVASLVLALGLTAQVAFAFRDRVAAASPALKPWLQQGCAVLGCRVGEYRQIESLSVESSALVKVESAPVYRLSVTLRNRADLDVAAPALDLSLTDVQGRPIARRVLQMQDLGLPLRSLKPRSELPIQATLGIGDRPVSGYTVEIFYP